LDFLPVVPKLTKVRNTLRLDIQICFQEVKTLVEYIERDMAESSGVIGIISFENFPSLNLPGSIPVYVSIISNDVLPNQSINVDKKFYNDETGFMNALSEIGKEKSSDFSERFKFGRILELSCWKRKKMNHVLLNKEKLSSGVCGLKTLVEVTRRTVSRTRAIYSSGRRLPMREMAH